MDKAHEWTEEQISELTQKFKTVYAEAQRISTDRLGEYLNQFDKLDTEMRKKVAKGEVAQKEYYAWRKKKMLFQQRYSSTLKDMATAYNNADVLAMRYLNNSLPMILGANFDFGATQIFNMKWSFKLYDQKTIGRLIAAKPDLLPIIDIDKSKNLDWYQKKLNSAITQGILHGDSIPKIAKQLEKVTESGKAAAIRNTRTAITSAECAGRDESYRMAQADGVDLVREWRATLDGRTRHSHAAIDGEQREVGEAFSNGCMHPGDPNGAPAEVYNCRCTIVGRVKGYEKYHQRGKYGNGKLGDETYEEWKERHIAALEEEKAEKSGRGLKGNDNSGIINEEKYRAFSDGKEVNDFFYYDSESRGLLAKKNSEHGKWTASLSQQQRIDIGSYCADGYADINSYWRKYGNWQDINAEKVKSQTKSLDEAIASYNLKADIKTYRAVQPEAFQDYWDNIQSLVGKEYTDPAFMSTSPFKGSDAVNKDCIMELLIPAGQGRGAYINQLSGFQDSEYEFLLARDSKFKIYSVEETEEKLILKMEMIV